MRTYLAYGAAVLLALPLPAAVPDLAGQQPEAAETTVADLAALVAQLRGELLRAGERVEGWDRGGANPDADLRSRGADRHYFLTRGRDGTSVTILTDRPIADLAPAGWRVVDSYGSAAASLPGAQVDFMPYSARYVMASRGQMRRVRDVDCQDNLSHALLYEVPDAPASPIDADVAMMFRLLILALEDQDICFRAEGDAGRGYRGRYFLPDGRSLPALDDADAVTTIVPAAPIDRLIEAPPPESATTED